MDMSGQHHAPVALNRDMNSGAHEIGGWMSTKAVLDE
jgi:hypothetical protein